MRAWGPEQLAEAAGARLLRASAEPAAGGPGRAVVDSREAGPGDLFVGLPGTRVDGGTFAAEVAARGAWVLARPEHLQDVDGPAVLAAEDPLLALQALATAWRRALGAAVVGVTGSVGKTSTKDVLRALVASSGTAVHANDRNLNTEIGLPLTVLAAPPATEVLVLEMGMRGPGQIAELARIAEPDVGIVTALGPVHLEQLGSMEAIAAEKGSLLTHLPDHGTAVVPHGERLLDPHLPPFPATTLTFGPGGDVTPADLAGLELPFTAAHLQSNAAAALAACQALGLTPRAPVELRMSELRGERLELASGVTIVNDCYNANPVSMRAALDDLAATAPGRRVAVLGDMRELGPGEAAFHEEIGRYAREVSGVELLVAVGPLSASYPADLHVATAAEAADRVPGLLREGDTVLVKASRGIGLEVVAEALA